ncbi:MULTISPECIES: TonB-dependent siderophore receptor [Achromobacter]|jgi:iron complex outermembrane receptor protein|uniref:TonB-dependent siderophore receptor n=1 Tax=Achromobacter TaxID=222 RepID=UPI000A9AE1D0|nr:MULTISPECIES: TonB-dependent siderophore receptor [Achromobacter]MCZ8397304.1 TonB-dependent siderophore receptor [Achromobacter ruhlandii]CAB3637674.1 Ferrichrome outer membrane transporter/phage receptor [Achromobacter dolens]
MPRLSRASLLLTAALTAPAAFAQPARLVYDLPAAPLATTLNRIAVQNDRVLSVDPALMRGLDAPALHGSYTLDEALRHVTAGSGLEPVALPGGALTFKRNAQAVPILTPISVTGAAENAWGPVQGYVARRSATATKTDTPIIETPQSISVITADRYNTLGATNIKDALAYTPGVSTTTYGSDSRYDWVSLRGFDAYTPGFYLDGLPLRNNGNWGIWQTENYGAERIELLRGPASVLFGQTGPGGLINVVSKRPQEEPLRELQAQVGDHQRRRLAADFTGPMDEDGKWLYRFVGMGLDSELPAHGIDNDRLYLAPSLTWRPSTDTTLTLLTQYATKRGGTYTRARPAVGSLVPTPAGTHIPASLFVGEPGYDYFNQTQWMAGYELEHRVSDALTLRQNLRYGHLDLDYSAVQASGYASVNDDVTDPANYQVLRRSAFGSREHIASFNVDNQVQTDLSLGNWHHRILVGVDYQRNRIDQVSFSGGKAPPLDINDPKYRQGPITRAKPWMDADLTLAQTGVYLQDQIKWNERWVATLGGRYDSADNKLRDRQDGTTTRISSHKFTSRAGLVYVDPTGWAPYVSYGESFIPTATVDSSQRKPFKPETSRQYEAGLRYQPPGTKDSYSVAAFDLRRRNYITYDADSIPRQTGEVTVRGVEFEATVQPIPRLNVIAAYSWTPKAAVTASSNPDEIGRQATAVPRNRASLWVDYRFESRIKVGVGARFTGANYGDGSQAPKQVPSFVLFDAMIGYDIDRWSLALNARNLTNKTYFANCGYGNCYYGDPRTVIATASYRW